MLIFASGAFGLLARGETHITRAVFNHLVLGVGAGLVLMVTAALIDYRKLQPYAIGIFVTALIATCLVFVPGIGMEHGGGKRWINFGFGTFQPAELLKLAGIILSAAYFSAIGVRTQTLKWGVGGLCAIMALPVLLLVLQPDMGTLGVVCIGICTVFFVAGARFHHIATLIVIGFLLIGILAVFRPYVRDRIVTFVNPAHNSQSEGYQIRQSLIAIGSGGMTGRGFGQGIQKFTYLPEPMGDSIFAVIGEELGFVGSVVFIIGFLLLCLRGYSVAARAPDAFGLYLGVGIATYLSAEAFINIGAMLGVVPLTGIPLTFVSQGGSAMIVSLLSAGILLNISRARKG